MSFFHIGDEPSARHPHVAVLSASGEIDCLASPQLRTRLLAQAQAGRRRIVLDLSAVTFIDSTAIGAIVSAAQRLSEDGGSLTVVCGEHNARVGRILDITGVAEMIVLRHSLHEALDELDGARAQPRRAGARPQHAGALPDGSAQVPASAAASGQPRTQRPRGRPAMAPRRAARRYAEAAAARWCLDLRVDELA